MAEYNSLMEVLYSLKVRSRDQCQWTVTSVPLFAGTCLILHRRNPEIMWFLNIILSYNTRHRLIAVASYQAAQFYCDPPAAFIQKFPVVL